MRIKAERDKSEEEQLQLKKEVEKLLIKRANDAEDKVKQRHELMQIMEELNAENLKLQRKVALEDNVMKELKIEKKIVASNYKLESFDKVHGICSCSFIVHQM